MAVFLGSLEYALEEGPRWDWLDDGTIRAAVIVSAITSVLFFWRVLTFRQPIVDLRTFSNRNFAMGTFYTFIIGTGLYGTTYVIPLFLAQVRGLAHSDRHDGGRHRTRADGDVAVHRPRCAQARPADHAGIGMALFALAMYLTAELDQPGGLSRAARAADRARHRADVLLPAGQSDLAQHAAGRHAEKRRRALQSDRDLGGAHRPRRRSARS